MTAIPFIDAHIHLWDLDRFRYPWLTPPFSHDGPNGSVEPIASTYLPSHYRADAAAWNVVGAVHIDAGAAADEALAETQWLEGLADSEGLPSAIVAFAALDDPDVEALLAAQAAHPRVRGIRHIINWHHNPRRTYTPRDVTGDAAWQAGFGLLAKYGLSFDLQCYPGQMMGLSRLIAQHPDIQVILNHAGMPVDTDATGLAIWRAGLRALAALPNVAIKLSGVGFIHRSWTVGQVRPYILDAINIFGADRCMFASDTPTDKLFGSFDRHMDAYHSIVVDFPEEQRRALFGRNANRIYRMGMNLD